jgi:HD-GYP domain-containing protein (c-di-GMP phosphodiesterase class II)
MVQESSLSDAALTTAKSLLSPMDYVRQEFLNRRVEKAPTYLQSIVAASSVLTAQLVSSSGTVQIQSMVASIRTEEENILKELQSSPEPSDPFTQEEKKALENLSEKQNNVRQELGKASDVLGRVSRKTAMIGRSVIDNLAKAEVGMKNSSLELDRYESKMAKRSEESALDALMNIQNELSQADDAMSGLAEQEGGQVPGPGGVRAVRRSTGMAGGSPVGKVRIPRAEEFRAPKAFREEILESLKEKYPKTYESLIEKYYKRITE